MTGASEAVLRLTASLDGKVAVVGDGPVAQRLREALANRLAGAGARPGVVVDTTGNVEVIQQSLARVDDLGTIVLAGPSGGENGPLDLYDDLHVRGLTLIGVAPDLSGG
jgi:threonine dehydrogenase-like Zn-dependent dehydrogenase